MTSRRKPPSDGPEGPPAGVEPEEPAEVRELKARYLRLAADFDNFKKRARQEQMETIRFANAELVKRLLPIVDDFQRALEQAPERIDQSWRKGLDLVHQKLEELLAAQGVLPIEAVGAAFDPSLHEAIGHEESSEHPEDTVVREVRRGYRMHDRVVRPALVKVSRPPALTP